MALSQETGCATGLSQNMQHTKLEKSLQSIKKYTNKQTYSKTNISC